MLVAFPVGVTPSTPQAPLQPAGTIGFMPFRHSSPPASLLRPHQQIQEDPLIAHSLPWLLPELAHPTVDASIPCPPPPGSAPAPHLLLQHTGQGVPPVHPPPLALSVLRRPKLQ